jgi:hypothetical protein
MTAQIPEKLILDGQETPMTCCPSLPEGHPRIFEPDLDEVRPFRRTGSREPFALQLAR